MDRFGDVHVGRALDVVGERDEAQEHGRRDADDQRDDVGDVHIHKDHVGDSAADGGDSVEIARLKDSGRASQAYIANHASADRGEKAHGHADKRLESVDVRLIGARGGKEPHREDIEDRDKAVLLLQNLVERTADAGYSKA